MSTAQAIDLMHLGRDRLICAYDRDGLIVDPGPASCLERLLHGLDGEPRALLLTHIHLDHAGAAGALVRRYPALRVYVHEAGARHLADPSKLLASARKLYGERMDELWGEVLPVPEENLQPLQGGETVDGLRVEYTPGHASHHVCYLHEETGDAYVGDVAGVRIPPATYTSPPTPPPDIDLEAWQASIDTVERWRPSALCLTHFGRFTDVPEQLERTREQLIAYGELARAGDRQSFLNQIEREVGAATDPDTASRYHPAAPYDQLWLGLERYWRKRGEREAALAEGSAR